MRERDNLKQVLAALDLKKSEYDAAVGAAAAEVAGQIQNTAKRMVNIKRKGHPYPATSGEPPMQVTGNLMRSIKGEHKRKGFGVYVAEVGAYAVYSRSLEFGNPKWKNGQKFPFMQPSLELFKKTHSVKKIIAKHIRRASNG